jgi:hypothetical protein
VQGGGSCQSRRNRRVVVGMLFGGIGTISAAAASEFKLGEVDVVVKGTASVGTSLRLEGPDPKLIPRPNGLAAGMPGTAASGQNQDDGNLNFRRGEPVSTVAKTLVDVEMKYGQVGAFMRVMAWRDFALADARHPWGNIPNGFAPDARLGESSDRVYGRFAGAALLDANVYADFKVAEHAVHARLGNQPIPWGVPAAIPGGLAGLNPVNVPALRRPGAQLEELFIPVPAAFVRVGLTSTINLEAFWQVAHVRTEVDPCGSFHASADSIADRCDKIFVRLDYDDRQALAEGYFVKRAPDIRPSDGREFGIGLTHRAEAIATRFGAYFAQYHSRAPLAGAIRSGRPAAPFVPGDPDGLNPLYFVEYPEDIRLVAANFVSRWPDLSLFGEITHRFNQPLQLSPFDLINGFVSDVAPSPLRNDVLATPPGGRYHGYDRHRTTDLQFGAARTFPGVLGASALALGGELGVKYVHDLPDVRLRRYGRSDVFGPGPVGGLCSPGFPPETCSSDGFVTSLAWSTRARASLTYANAAPDLDVTPSVTCGWDVSGWAYDGAFSQGRRFALVALRGEYKKRFAAEIIYAPVWGGTYDNTRDRDVLTLVASAKF